MSAEAESRAHRAVASREAVARMTVEPLLDAKGAAMLLNVPATWVLAEARADRIPHVRLGRYVRFDATELNAWWQGRRRGPWRSRGTAADAAPSIDRSATGGRTAA